MSDDGLTDGDRERHVALREVLEAHPPDMGAEGVLVGYVLLTEWADAAGERWIAATESPGMPSWHRSGMLHDRLYDWPSAPPDDD